MDLNALAREVVRLLKEDNIVFFLGVGASLGTSEEQSAGKGVHSSTSLAASIVDEFSLDTSSSDLRDVASLAALAEDRRPMAVKKYVAQQIRDRARLPLKAHEALARIYPPLVVTTNYDDLYEKALDTSGKDYEQIVNQRNLSYSPRRRRTVIKLHGDVRDPKSLVLTGMDYLEWQGRAEALFVDVASEFQRSPCLFIGYSLADENLRAIVSSVRSRLGDDAPRHYALVKEVDKAKAASLREAVTFVEGDATELLERIADLWEAERPSPIDLLVEQRRLGELIESGRFEDAVASCHRIETELRKNEAFGAAAARWTDLAEAAESANRMDVATVAYTEAGELLLASGSNTYAESTLVQARRNAQVANMPPQEHKIVELLLKARALGGDYQEILQDVEQTLQSYGDSGPPDLLYSLFARRAEARQILGEDRTALAELRDALKVMPEGTTYQRTKIRALIAHIHATLFEWKGAHQVLDEGLEELAAETTSGTSSAEQERGTAIINLIRANIYQAVGEDNEARRLYSACMEVFETSNDVSFLVSALQGYIDCGYYLGYSPGRDLRARLADNARISSEHREAKDRERRGIVSLAESNLAQARSELLGAIMSAQAVHSPERERSSRNWYAKVLLDANFKVEALQQFILAGNRRASGQLAEEIADSIASNEQPLSNLIADTVEVASGGDYRARGAALVALKQLEDVIPETSLPSIAEYLSRMDALPSDVMEGRNLLSEAGRFAVSAMPRLSQRQAVEVGQALIRTLERTDCFQTAYEEACLALANLSRLHPDIISELAIPVDRLAALVGDDVINDRHKAMTALVNLALEGHAASREKALQVLQAGTSVQHMAWRYTLGDTTEGEISNLIRNSLPHDLGMGRVHEHEDGMQSVSGGRSPSFLMYFDLPTEINEEVTTALVEAVSDPQLLIVHRQAAASVLGAMAEQLGEEARQRAIKVLMNLLSADHLEAHPMLQGITNPLSALQINMGQMEDVRAAAAKSLLHLSPWMDEGQRQALMDQLERLRAMRTYLFEMAIAGGIGHFKPQNDTEKDWLTTRLLLLLNVSDPNVRSSAARSLGNLIATGALNFDPVLLHTTLIMADTTSVKDRYGAAYVLARAIKNSDWARDKVSLVLDSLKPDRSFSVRKAAQLED